MTPAVPVRTHAIAGFSEPSGLPDAACRHCYGTGTPGSLVVYGPEGTHALPLRCACVQIGNTIGKPWNRSREAARRRARMSRGRTVL